jgi:hypothetical protein
LVSCQKRWKAGSRSPCSTTVASVAQVVEHRGGFFEEQRQVVLDAGGGHAVAHVFVDAALGRVAVQQFAPAAAELGARVVVHRELAARQQAHFGHGVEAALAVRVEGADAVDLVVEQVDAKGTSEPMGNKSISPPRTAYSPGLTTCVTWL